MIAALKSELRKLLTIRSAYLVFILAIGLSMLISFWTSGVKAEGTFDAHYLQSVIYGTISGVGFFVGIVPLLLITHEYRHNTIFYTLTSNRSRSSVLAAKLAVITKYVLVFTVVAVLTAIAATLVGLRIGDHTLAAQQFDWWPLVWRSLFYMLAIGYMAAIFGLLIRNQVGAFVAYLLYPGTVETLLGFVLKDNGKYLPFRAISDVLIGGGQGMSLHRLALVAAAWIVGGLLVSWLLFVRRDAN